VTEATFLLDTNICIYVLQDGNGPAAQRLAASAEGSVAVSTVTLAELLRGQRASDSVLRNAVEEFLHAAVLVPFDGAAAHAYVSVPFKRGTFDRLIAAQALAHNLVVVTNNERDFADVPGLRIENWAQP
jgi:tRNA(fMet)-specific endonuclease VapC